MHLSEQEQERIGALVRRIEVRTGVQVVAAVVGRSDSYPEAPWKAFALGCSVAALVVAGGAVTQPGWVGLNALLWSLAVVLLAGALLAAAAVFIAPVGALFIDRDRRELEVRQHAQSLFLTHELHATRGRIGVLLLVSLLEREVVVLPDSGLRSRIAPDSLERIIAEMKPELRRGRPGAALVDGLTELERLAIRHGVTRQPGIHDELPDAIIQLERPR